MNWVPLKLHWFSIKNIFSTFWLHRLSQNQIRNLASSQAKFKFKFTHTIPNMYTFSLKTSKIQRSKYVCSTSGFQIRLVPSKNSFSLEAVSLWMIVEAQSFFFWKEMTMEFFKNQMTTEFLWNLPCLSKLSCTKSCQSLNDGSSFGDFFLKTDDYGTLQFKN